MNDDVNHRADLPFLFAPATICELPALDVQQVQDVESQTMLDGDVRVRKRWGILTYERLSEFILTNIFFGLESYYDITKVPENYTEFFGVTRESVAKLALTPEVANMLNSMGDVLEISVGSGMVRFSLAVVEEILKSGPVKQLVVNTLQHVQFKNLLERSIGKEKTDELSRTGEIKMSDDAQFWAALIPWTVVKAAHSLGLISLGAHDHIGAPVPHMLIGQAFAMASLIGVHYGTKNSDNIIHVTRDVFCKTKDMANDMRQDLSRRYDGFEATLLQGIADHSGSINKQLDAFYQSMEEWTRKMEAFDPGKVVPPPEEIYQKVLGERFWKAISAIGIENDRDNLE